MNTDLFEKWRYENLISDVSLQKAKTLSKNTFFSVHWELKTLLYLGVLMLSGGLGILIYKNIDTIGHTVILLFMALVCVGCFYYCIRKKRPFSWQKVEAPNGFFDYILLLGCLTFVTFITYLQAQYEVFGTRYGSVAFIPLVVLLVSAYYFDHLGVLSMAIVNLAAWMGIAITPMQLLAENDFSDARLIYTGVLLGILLIAAAFASNDRNIKKHFAFTFSNFGAHILFIACLAALFTFEDMYPVWFLILAGVTVFLYRQALRNRSFYFLVVIILYAYIGLSYMIMQFFTFTDGIGSLYLLLIWFIGSGIGLVRLLMHLNKKLKQHDSV
jgi:hypothetical protein